ncbi:hypothetical protein IDSA_01265 [Pseudidiomarina salinarum]|uniref:Lipoprotein n=1 Tax=Pseudidiomarina salinarum TaxID=435908 RepID=A0A094J011_9GAMM|nr:hypothetical protein [Pseudidiomarina salinarum]KFZ31379.1 hypothetical protein IDSA_01265 [Pseudidiomarina salinarum]RUO70860.1 hypothetical protein CWI79_05305 [Pseudidiomarina salinarum]
MLKPLFSALALIFLLSACGQPDSGNQSGNENGSDAELEETLTELQQEGKQLSSEVINKVEEVLRSTEATVEEKTAALRELDMDIRDLVGVPYADDLSQCRLIAVGSRPCGGPEYYLPYSTKSVDPDVIEPLVNSYTELQSWFHEEHQVMGTCEVVPEPNLTINDGICIATPNEMM